MIMLESFETVSSFKIYESKRVVVDMEYLLVT